MTRLSYCSHIHAFEAVSGQLISFSRTANGSLLGSAKSALLMAACFGVGTCGRSYLGALSTSGGTGISHHVLPYMLSFNCFVSLVSPITAKSRSHLSKMALAFSSDPGFKIINIRSCDSESIISYGIIAVSRCGTLSKSRVTPIPPLSAISTDEEVRPAAPIS